MRTIASSRQTISRIGQLAALSCVIALAACDDITAPEEATAPAASSPAPPQSSVNRELGEFGSSLDDITGWALVSIADSKGLASIAGILNSLKGHLASGKIAACQQDVTDARAFLGSLTENEQVELGGVGVTLDVIQSVLDRASQ